MNNQIEILLVKKRYSYYFVNFVLGRYNPGDSEYLRYMFDNMSFSEKIHIIGMRFENMWYHMWLCNPMQKYDISDVYLKPCSEETAIDRCKIFLKKKAKFEKNFMKDGGQRLRELIVGSTCIDGIWEIPKGGKNGPETVLDCAIREFQEETSIDRNKYRIFYGARPITDYFIDDKIEYLSYYYLATPTDEIFPRIDFSNFEQISEIEQVKWISLQELKILCLAPREKKRLEYLFKKVLYHFRRAIKIE